MRPMHAAPMRNWALWPPVAGSRHTARETYMNLDIEARGARMARIWIRISVIYLMAGVGLGIYMAANMAFQYAPVHAHVQLVGWASMALAGLIYDRFPKAGGSRLGLAHFWLHNLALPFAMLMLFLVLGGNMDVKPLLTAGEIGLALGLALFTANVQLNLKR